MKRSVVRAGRLGVMPGRSPFRMVSSNQVRWFAVSGSGDEQDEYPEELQKKQIKAPEFYEQHALDRKYFYHVDLLGRLYLEDMLPKNIATSLKSPKFLDFFWRNLRPNNLGEFDDDYAFISPCGKEMNFIRPADRPIVFHELKRDEEGDGSYRLIYAATHWETFDPSKLVWDLETNRIYHPISKHKRMAGTLGLVKSSVASELSKHFVIHENDNDSVYLSWQGKEYLIRILFDENHTYPESRGIVEMYLFMNQKN